MNYIDEEQRLEQSILEDMYSSRNIKDIVMEDLVDLKEHIVPLFQVLSDYLHSNEFYSGKRTRVNFIEFLDPWEIIERVLVQVLQSRTEVSIQSVVGSLLPWLGYEKTRDGLNTAAELIGLCSTTGLYTIVLPRDSESGMCTLKPNVELEDRVYEFIARTMYLPPLVCIPNEVKSNSDTGYLESNGSILLNNTHHEGEICLDVINKQSDIALELDYEACQYQQPYNESSKQLSPREEALRKRTYLTQRGVTEQLHTDYMGKPFWFNYKYDSRGRSYSQGFHINIQSSDQHKSCISLYEKETIDLPTQF